MIEGLYATNATSPYSPTRRNPTGTFLAAPPSGVAGNPTNVTLTWSFDLGVSASIDQGIGPVALSGNTVVNGLTASRTWTISIVKLDGTTYQQQVSYTAS